jgi:hypothetical protein
VLSYNIEARGCSEAQTSIKTRGSLTFVCLLPEFILPEFNCVPCSDLGRVIIVFPKVLGWSGSVGVATESGLDVFTMACCLINEPERQLYLYLAI